MTLKTRLCNWAVAASPTECQSRLLTCRLLTCRGRRLQAGLPLQAAFGGGLLPLAVPDTSFDAVQLLDWENGIYWGEDRSPTPSLALIVEEDEDHLSGVHRPHKDCRGMGVAQRFGV